MISTPDQMTPIMNENNTALLSAVIGAAVALFGVIITEIITSCRRKKDKIENAKPIIINYLNESVTTNPLTTYIFRSDSGDTTDITGSFKNTDNGLLFLDYVDIGSKRFNPKVFAVVDKNTEFSITLQGLGGASLDNEIRLYFHDVFGNPYYYRLNQTGSSRKYIRIALADDEPQPVNKAKK